MRNVWLCMLLVFGYFWTRPAALNAANEQVKIGYAVEATPIEETLNFDSTPWIQLRKVIDIPQDFGKIIHIYPDTSGGVVFWLEAGDGRVRNVFVKEASEPVIIRRKGKVN